MQLIIDIDPRDAYYIKDAIAKAEFDAYAKAAETESEDNRARYEQLHDLKVRVNKAMLEGLLRP